jgi:hypothetical protein
MEMVRDVVQVQAPEGMVTVSPFEAVATAAATSDCVQLFALMVAACEDAADRRHKHNTNRFME